MDAANDQQQMAPPTANALEARLSAIAVECGIILKDGYAGFPPDAPPDVDQVAEEKGYQEAVWPWRRLMAECVNYLSIQSLTFEGLLRRAQGEPSNFLRASWSLSTKAASDARCAIHLCDHGFVAQASIVARSCIEAIEALAAFTLEPSRADAFVAAQTPDEANRAWFLLIRKKARRAMDNAFADIVEIDQETAEWRHNNRRVLSTLTHPSYLAPLLNLYSQWEDGKGAHPTLPARTMDCVNIFQAVADSCFEYASLLLLAVNGPRRGPDIGDVRSVAPYQNVGFFKDDWLDSYASRGHKFFQHVWMFYLKYQDESPFSIWRARSWPAEEAVGQ